MTDQAAGHHERDPLVIVVDAQYVFDLERRVAELELRPATAQLPPEVSDVIARALDEHERRLGRHRVELEQIKGTVNDAVDYIRQNTPAGAPAIEGNPL